MPNVPKAPGVPALASFAAQAIALLTFDAALPQPGAPRWGIFLDGAQALPYRSIASFDYRQDWSISDYPVEEGAFQSYDKVQLPFDARVRITSHGTLAGRQALLAALDGVANSLDLYDIVTPERVYTSVNVSHYSLARDARGGVGMLVVDVWFTEIRVADATQFSNTQQPAQAGRQSVGTVQAQEPTDAFGSLPTPR